MSKPSWTERLFGGFKKTSERLSENLTEAVTRRGWTMRRWTMSKTR